MRAKGYEAIFVDVSPESLATNKPSYQFELSTENMIGQFSVWVTGECDFDIVDTRIGKLKQDLAGQRVDDGNFETTFDRFADLVITA